MKLTVAGCLFALASITYAKPAPRDTYAMACWGTVEEYKFDGCPEGRSDRACLCRSEPFMASVLSCARAHSETRSKTQWKNTLERLLHECDINGESNHWTQDSLEELTKSTVASHSNATSNMAADKSFGVHESAIIVDRAKSAEAVKALGGTKGNKKRAVYFGGAMMATLGLLMVWGMIQNFCFILGHSILKNFDGSFSRRLRKRFFLAPTGKKHHSNPVVFWKRFTLNMPTRIQTVFLTLYMIENLIFLCVGYYCVPPEYQHLMKRPTSTSGQLVRYLGVRSGVLVTMQMPLMWLFAGRNNFFLWLTGWPLDSFNVLHKWLGRITMFNLCIHGIVYTMSETMYRMRYAKMWHKQYWIFGNIAFFAGLIIFFQGMHILRCKRYDLFLGIHILLAAVFMAGAFRHLVELHYVEYVYAAFGWWMFERLVRVGRILYSGINSRASIKLHPDNIIQIDIKYSNRWKFYPGSYGFLHFVQKNRFWQNHPFTFIHHPDDPSRLQCFARVKDGMTKRIADQLRENSNSAGDDQALDIGIWIDGPYGSQQHVHKYDSAVFFAGGIGITGTYTYAQDLVGIAKDCSFKFIWVVSDIRTLSWFKDHITHLLKDPRFAVQIWYNQRNGQSSSNSSSRNSSIVDEDTSDTGATPTLQEVAEKDTKELDYMDNATQAAEDLQRFPNFSISQGIPNINEVVQNASQEEKRSLAVLSCGPGTMNDDVRAAVRDSLEGATCRMDYFEESFSW